MVKFAQVRLYAAARAAAGVPEVMVNEGPLKEILAIVSADNERLKEVLLRCSFLVDEVVCHDMNTWVPAGSIVDVLPPFAGG